MVLRRGFVWIALYVKAFVAPVHPSRVLLDNRREQDEDATNTKPLNSALNDPRVTGLDQRRKREREWMQLSGSPRLPAYALLLPRLFGPAGACE